MYIHLNVCKQMSKSQRIICVRLKNFKPFNCVKRMSLGLFKNVINKNVFTNHIYIYIYIYIYILRIWYQITHNGGYAIKTKPNHYQLLQLGERVGCQLIYKG